MTQSLPLALFSMPGGYEWLVIGLVALLLFGKRLPSVAKSLGQALHEFKSGFAGTADTSESKEAKDASDKTSDKTNQST